MRKKSLMLSISLIAILIIAGSSIAYFNSKDSKDNVFTVGDVDIELTEPGWKPEEDHIIEPGAAFTKDPTVTNIGKTDAYVRINMTTTDGQLIDDLMKDATYSAEIDKLFPYDSDEWTQGEFVLEGDTLKVSFIRPAILNAGQSAKPLFKDKVTFSDQIPQNELDRFGETFEMSFTADAIQAEGFANATEAFEAFDNN